MAVSLPHQYRVSPEPGRISVARLRKDLGISRERMGRLLDVSARTIQRWEERDALPSNRWVLQVLIDVQNIVDLGLQVFEPRGVHLIMTTLQPGFGDKSGLELVEAGRSDEVIGYLAGAYEGFLGT
ncbi:MAG: helix-turn-helix domain-containing protein [Chloroflexota bacterium]|nr:helix-turn-helix domain-containing protein [Chloroflexota bacterium]